MPIWTKTTHPTFTDRNRVRKRNVISTDIGWVRRNVKGTRVQDEMLNVMNDLQAGMEEPTIFDVYYGAESYAAGEAGEVFVVFDEPIAFANSSANVTLNLIDGANTITATCVANNTNIVGANNTLYFTFTAVEGTYTVANTISASSANVYSTNVDNEEVDYSIANTVITLAGPIVITA